MKSTALQAVLAGVFLLAGPLPGHTHGNEKHDGQAAVAEPGDDAEQMPWGIAGSPKKAGRTVEFSMGDEMRFTPGKLTVQQGETVRFKVTNNGKLMHEFVIGTLESNAEHAELMMRFPNMEHDEPYMTHVAPGETGEIVWHFNRAGEFQFACLIAGHYQAGMVGDLTVAAR